MFQPLKPSSNDPVKSSDVASAILTLASVGSWYGSYWLAVHVMPPVEGLNVYPLISGGIPFFFALMFLEMLLLKLFPLRPCTGAAYELADSWSSMAAGMVENTVMHALNIFCPVLLVYMHVYDNYALVKLPEDEWWVFALGIVAADFVYYWFHRVAHQINIFWAGHAVHHHTEHYNLTTALRQSWWQSMLSSLWNLPLALFVPTKVLFIAMNWTAIYQFWVHSCLIRRLGPFEYVFATPSHHRVHHDRRLHKNHGGIFIVWDRMFGTFLDELDHRPGKDKPQGDETCYFGTRETVTSFTEIVTQLMLWRPCFRSVKHFFIGPGWITTAAPRAVPVNCNPSVQRIRLRCSIGYAGSVYLLTHFTFLIAAFMFLTTQDVVGAYGRSGALALAAFLLASLLTQGLMLDGQMVSVFLELARLCVLFLAAQKYHVQYVAAFCAVSTAVCILFNTRLLGLKTVTK